jgi:hypothetical protein
MLTAHSNTVNWYSSINMWMVMGRTPGVQFTAEAGTFVFVNMSKPCMGSTRISSGLNKWGLIHSLRQRFFTSLPWSDHLFGWHSLLSGMYQGHLLVGDKVAGAWSWMLISIHPHIFMAWWFSTGTVLPNCLSDDITSSYIIDYTIKHYINSN